MKFQLLVLLLVFVNFVPISESSSTREREKLSLDYEEERLRLQKVNGSHVGPENEGNQQGSVMMNSFNKNATDSKNGTVAPEIVDSGGEKTTNKTNSDNFQDATSTESPNNTTSIPVIKPYNKPTISTSNVTLLINSTIVKARAMGKFMPATKIETPKVGHNAHDVGHDENFHNYDYENITDGDLSTFDKCVTQQCHALCRETKLSLCDKQNDKICLCAAFKFVPIEIEGLVNIPTMTDPTEKTCSESCIARSSYARILIGKNGKKQCVCLTHQVSKSGITYCDNSAIVDVCKNICKSEAARCAFNGVCLCSYWPQFYNLSAELVREEVLTDHSECSKRCSLYHHDFVGRIYDKTIGKSEPQEQVESPAHTFRSKYCLCGPESMIHSYNHTKEIISEGFHICSGLKCKQRCGMKDAICEPIYRRACLCHRQNIFIGPHLWSRLPSHSEKFCQDACFSHGLQSRVIEKNPLFIPSSEKFHPWYRSSMFSYGYDGKFCHCIKIELDMNQFRPCTDEICQWLCGHAGAECDKGTRRDCICNTHKLIGGLGRKADPGEINCEITCRYMLMDAKVIDVTWDTDNMDGWGVQKSKFCGCIRPTSPAGLTHCDGDNDHCPLYCKNQEAYCTRDKYCECGIANPVTLLSHGAVRIPNGPENEECYELCRSWLWPIAEDLDNNAFIYDEGRELCSKTDSCPEIDSTIWDPDTIGFHVDKNIRDEIEPHQPRKICLCSKTTRVHYKPGTRFLPNMMPHKALRGLECVGNRTCVAVGNSIHIK